MNNRWMVGVLCLAVVGTGATAAGATQPDPVTSTSGVEVTTYGVVQVRPYQAAKNSPVTIAVHGVHRVDDATVVYLSVGYEDPALGDLGGTLGAGLSELVGTQIGGRYLGGDALTSTRIVDTAESVVLSVVPDPAGRLGPDTPLGYVSPQSAFPDEPGVMAAVYAVLPPLAEGTRSVDVQVGFGSVIADVPVADDVLEPALDPESVIPLGTGWPRLDPRSLDSIEDPDRSVHPLTQVSEAIDRSTATTETTETVTIDLASDVVFAVDSADLSPQAQTRLNEIATEITTRAAAGSLSVVGHTDSTADDAYNEDLSRRRAEAVAAVLGPTAQSVGLTLVVEGRGEREPVADNNTDAGRQANRRVSISFSIENPSEVGP